LPRLAGCSGPVLAVEWDPPLDDGGVGVVAYRVWVRPYSVSEADGAEWTEVGQVRHVEGCVQRAEIHTEDLHPGISRYLCAVAAVNDAGEVGPRTSDSASLPLPNPCAVCGPTPHTALGDLPAPADGGPTMTLLEPGKRPLRVPILAHGAGSFQQEVHFEPGASQPGIGAAALAAYGRPAAAGGPLGPCDGMPAGVQPAYSGFPDPQHGWGGGGLRGEALGPPGYADAPYGGSYVAAASFHEYPGGGHAGAGAAINASGFASPGCGGGVLSPSTQPSQEEVDRDIIAARLEEMRGKLDASLARYQEAGHQLQRSPDSEWLVQSHEEAEIEAAGYQAEVAVLAQHLQDLDGAVQRQRGGAGTPGVAGSFEPLDGYGGLGRDVSAPALLA